VFVLARVADHDFPEHMTDVQVGVLAGHGKAAQRRIVEVRVYPDFLDRKLMFPLPADGFRDLVVSGLIAEEIRDQSPDFSDRAYAIRFNGSVESGALFNINFEGVLSAVSLVHTVSGETNRLA
jgi:hypothetical protein